MPPGDAKRVGGLEMGGVGGGVDKGRDARETRRRGGVCVREKSTMVTSARQQAADKCLGSPGHSPLKELCSLLGTYFT